MASKQQSSKIAELDEIPDEILGVKISTEDKEKLCNGNYTGLLVNLQHEGTIKDGKVKLSRNASGKLEFNFLFKKERMIIPDTIGKKKLSKQELEDLSNGKTILVNYKSNELYVKIDPEINSISISTGKELGIPDELGQYKLTDQDKINLANGKPIGTKVYKGVDGYFLANVKFSTDGKEMVFMDIKPLTKLEEIEKYIQEFNNLNLDQSNDSTRVSNNSIELNSGQRDIENTLSVADSAFKASIDNKEYKKLREMRDNGYNVTVEDVNYINSNSNLSNEEKLALKTALKTDEMMVQNNEPGIGSIKDEEGKSIVQTRNIDRKLENTGTAKHTEKIINQAFDNM